MHTGCYGGMSQKSKYPWFCAGDLNAFFGLMLDNVTNLVLLTVLLDGFQHNGVPFPRAFIFSHMIPGTALGVMFGDLVYTWMARRLARRTGRTDVTAMPLGLDTPSTIGHRAGGAGTGLRAKRRSRWWPGRWAWPP